MRAYSDIPRRWVLWLWDPEHGRMLFTRIAPGTGGPIPEVTDKAAVDASFAAMTTTDPREAYVFQSPQEAMSAHMSLSIGAMIGEGGPPPYCVGILPHRVAIRIGSEVRT